MAERPVHALKFQGLFGVWSWPLVNMFLERMGTLPKRGSATSLTATMANMESWEWEDYRGRKRHLVIHREVKE